MLLSPVAAIQKKSAGRNYLAWVWELSPFWRPQVCRKGRTAQLIYMHEKSALRQDRNFHELLPKLVQPFLEISHSFTCSFHFCDLHIVLFPPILQSTSGLLGEYDAGSCKLTHILRQSKCFFLWAVCTKSPEGPCPTKAWSEAKS